ncbi:MAG: hypothetical protein RLZ44_10 [Pseudomonadota bacterium]
MLRLLLLVLVGVTGVARADLVNRLAGSASPYLSAHADDLVRWQPLDPEALALAQRLDRPLFVAVGYLSCHWCHTMQQESYLDPQVAELLNRHFVPVLVDRELAPAVDQRLLDFVSRTRGQGGWPLHVIATPHGQPVTGFVYQTPTGLQSLLDAFIARWRAQAEHLTRLAVAAEQSYRAELRAGQALLQDHSLQDLLLALLDQAAAAADPQHGGFGSGSKFPSTPQLAALLELTAANPDPTLSAFLRQTLDAMLEGALQDQVGGGFFRYTTDPDWRTPHYEKMLYTNAQLVSLLTRAAQVLETPAYDAAALRTARFLVRDMQHPQGGFVAALSAMDAAGSDGGYYLWQAEELTALLNAAERSQVGNLLPGAADSVLPRFAADATSARAKLAAARRQRTLPRDHKRLVGWNALALTALAAVYQQLSQPEQAFAADLAQRLLQLARSPETLPYTLDGEQTADLASYSYLAWALVRWSQASGTPAASAAAGDLLHTALQRFHTADGWLSGPAAPLTVAVPMRTLQDDELPSPSAVWLRAARALALEPGRAQLRAAADRLALDWPQTMADNAFFHATQIADMVLRQIARVRAETVRHAP